MSGECDKCGEHIMDCIHTNKKSYTCGSCGLLDPKVEAEGIWHCPNALCRGSGGAWFRLTLNSYRDISASEHIVDEKEWRKKGREYNAKNKIPRQSFRRTKEKIEEMPETQSMEWISVKDRLPPKDTPVLCFYYDQYMDVMEYWFDDEADGTANFCHPNGVPIDEVTYWMPLPRPPNSND